ncbi:MAG: heme exporter protein CcmB [Bacteroidetes bacterium]|nr:heme exporter protein CcmB [Bacteroidota bacterium]MBP6640288.1 heme exporter protein CcmB [Bacteroidia bacterium]MBP6722088.1 heme exporter protein CcmB [Bacteroidia bacterium]MBP8073799.1 heme exporter protein CcmB [Bacteroidia bacterium]
MSFARETIALIKKEMLLEWKQKYALNGMLLYSLSMVFVVSIGLQRNLPAQAWNVVFWIILLFVSVNAVAKSFMGERTGQLLYLYNLAGARAIIVAKIIYNCLLLTGIALVTLVFFLLLSGTGKIADPLQYGLIVVIGSLAFAANLTLVSAIASKAQNQATLLAVLSFPILVPEMLVGITASGKAIQGLPIGASMSEIIFSVTFVVIIAAISVILFPFLWRD